MSRPKVRELAADLADERLAGAACAGWAPLFDAEVPGEDDNGRRYRLEDFHDAFERYLPARRESEGVQPRPNGDDQQERRDAFKSTDTFKASSVSRRPAENPSSDPIRTGLDTFGQVTADNCAECGFDGVPDGETMHHDCRSKYERRQQFDGGAA
ncbi:hypothetical protein IU485_16135 [Nocardia cyriacigeorgica]|uniref:hypothetical protein n=1 Tax=Nocardia cyriacigeorgica TaxID=135487 RepID=UPI001893CC7F|nr:hypothetical protein [Nocardia cyriacigeorgica]MBF6082894.1 hypothetical protein [Nocardia cyriacigeorgica]